MNGGFPKMMKKVCLFCLSILGVLILSLCSPMDDEKALRELVEKAAALGEKHDIGGIIDLTTEDFRAFPGDLDRRGCKRILFMAFRHYGELQVVHPRPDVDLESKEGGPSVTFPFLIVKKDRSVTDLKELYNDPGGWLEKVGETADLYRFKLGVVKVDGDWLVKTARLEKFTGAGYRE
jgi:hypothetical protein